LDYPLGRTDALAPVTVMANVLGDADPGRPGAMGMDERIHHLAARFPEAKLHLYGKAFRPGRKIGHVTMLGDDLPAIRHRARLAAAWLGSGTWLDGYRIHPAADRQALLRADGLTGRGARVR
jgi:5-(carboxyamino)imidazole ribonucleotide synthase